MSKTGSCLCGAVKIKADNLESNAGICHCDMCRRWSGGPLFAVDGGSDVSFEGEENIGVYQSSDWAERGFCKICGSNLYYRLKQKNQFVRMAGLFDESDYILDHQIFIDSKPDYYHFGNETKNMTGEEVFAYFAGTED